MAKNDHRHKPPAAGRSPFDPKQAKRSFPPKGQFTLQVGDMYLAPSDFVFTTEEVEPKPKKEKDDYFSEAVNSLRDLQLAQMERLFFGGAVHHGAVSQLDHDLAEARKKVADYLLETKHGIGWDDVVGNEAARTALLEAIEHPVKHRDLNAYYGVPAAKGVMLFGPPGCGKTMFGKAAAAALSRLHGRDVELLVINGPEIQSEYVGKTERTIREIFAYAKLYRKKHGHQLVIFIDEADAILPPRDSRAWWSASNVGTFLTEMDGLEDSGAFVILATNRPEQIDQALLRDGRCDRKIRVERPHRDAAHVILQRAMRGAPVGDVDLGQVVDHLFADKHLIRSFTIDATGEQLRFTLGHIVSGSMVVGLVGRAKGIAMRRDLAAGTRTGIQMADMLKAIDEVHGENATLNHDYALREFFEAVSSRPPSRPADAVLH